MKHRDFVKKHHAAGICLRVIHSQQHLKPEGFTHQFISGAGSELTPVHTGISYSGLKHRKMVLCIFRGTLPNCKMTAVNYKGDVLCKTDLTKA